MKPIKTLPFTYARYGRLDLSGGRFTLALNLAGLLLLFLIGWLLLRVMMAVRPEFAGTNLFLLADRVNLLELILTLVTVLLLHELIHGFFFWRFTGERPQLGFNLLYAYAAAPDWYIPRNQFLLVGIAPLAVIGLAGLALLPWLPATAVVLLYVAVTANSAGSLGDLLVVAWLLRQPAATLVRDTGPAMTAYHPAPEKLAQLQQQWETLLRPFASPADRLQAVFRQLVDAYSRDGRHYHNLNHVRHLLELLESWQEQIHDPTAVQLAAWFHDAVYDTMARDNERRSAELATELLPVLNVPTATIAAVVRLIQATQQHQAYEGDGDIRLFLDADLAILGSPPEIYNDYAQAIRREYGWVPDSDYRNGRCQLLEQFLQRDRIYHPDGPVAALEAQARQNLARERQELERGKK